MSSENELLPFIAPENETDKLLTLSRFIQKIHRRMNSGISPEMLFDFIFDSLNLVIPYDRIGIAVLARDGNEQKLVSHWVKSNLPVQHLKASYSASIENSGLRKIIEEGRPRIIDDLEVHLKTHPQSEFTSRILKDGIRSNLTCPLKAENQSIGVVFFSSAKPHTYRPEHAEIFLEVADELSMIVEQSRLREISRAMTSKDQNFRMALHDLKSPLGVMQGYINVAVEEEWFSDLNEDAKRIFETLNRNSHYMASLLDELSELVQLDRNISSSESKCVRLDELIADLSEDGKSLSAKKEISFEMKVHQDLPVEFRCDPIKIRRAINNLFTNAVKYSNRRTAIKFSVGIDAGHLKFAVTDEGQGIPESEIPKLFSEFGKTSVRPTEGEPSSGLGLAIVRKIALQHRGAVSVDSRFGRGSTFTVSMPFETDR